MDTESLVDERITSGTLLLRGLKEAGVQVAAAAWIRSEDDARWGLYLSLPMADKEGPLASYRAVQKASRSSESIQMNISDVVVVGNEHSITKGILGLGVPKGTRLQLKPTLIGHVMATGLYVYPQDGRRTISASVSHKVIVRDEIIAGATTADPGGVTIIRPDGDAKTPFTKSP